MSETPIDDPHPSDETPSARADQDEDDTAVDAGGTRIDEDEVEGPNPT